MSRFISSKINASALIFSALFFTCTLGACSMSQAKPVYMHDNTRPISFDHHNFGVRGYDLSDLKVYYSHSQFTSGTINPRPTKSPNAEKTWSSDALGIKNFPPPPAKVKWRAKDGTPLEASIDIGQIFKEQVILHKEDPKQLTKSRIPAGTPDIIVEVNNRTVNVYMKSDVNIIPIGKTEKDSETRYSLTLAYSKTY